jgi:hypothetical protein
MFNTNPLISAGIPSPHMGAGTNLSLGNTFGMGQNQFLPNGMRNPYMQQAPMVGDNPALGLGGSSGGQQTFGATSPMSGDMSMTGMGGIGGQVDGLGLPPDIAQLVGAGTGMYGDPLSATAQLGIPATGALRPGANPLVAGTPFNAGAIKILANIIRTAAPVDPQGTMRLLGMLKGDPSVENDATYRHAYEQVANLYNAAG